jgi:hypothetical protein
LPGGAQIREIGGAVQHQQLLSRLDDMRTKALHRHILEHRFGAPVGEGSDQLCQA